MMLILLTCILRLAHVKIDNCFNNVRRLQDSISHFKIAMTNVRVFDGNRICEPGSVFIDRELIDGSDTASTYEVDARGSVLLLGLIDAHIHLDGSEKLAQNACYDVIAALDIETRNS